VGADDAVPGRDVPALVGAGDLIRVEEYRQDGSLVIRADLPGIDPDIDVELTASGGMLHIEAERREEERREERATCGRRCATGRCPGRCRGPGA
jgi:HSP20 family molecular chaperone IbpA